MLISSKKKRFLPIWLSQRAKFLLFFYCWIVLLRALWAIIQKFQCLSFGCILVASLFGIVGYNKLAIHFTGCYCFGWCFCHVTNVFRLTRFGWVRLLKLENMQKPKYNELATFGMLLQLDLIYQFTSMFKVSPRWSADGSAIYYVLNNLAFVYPPVGRDILLKFVPFSVLSILTKATLLLERCAPLLIFVYPLRYVGVIAFITFHFGLFCSMRLGLFPLICIAGWIILIPSYLWSYDSKIEAAQDLIGSKLNGKGYSNLNGASLFTTWVIFAFGYCVLVLLQILAIYLALVSNINTLPKIVVKSPKLFNIFNLDSYFATFANRYIFEMPPTIYQIARFLGQNQQWFLFDRPQEYSFWFDVVGWLRSNAVIPLLFQKKRPLNAWTCKILQMYVNDNYFCRLVMQNDHFKIHHQYCTDQSQEKLMLYTTNLTGRNYSRTIVFGNYTND